MRQKAESGDNLMVRISLHPAESPLGLLDGAQNTSGCSIFGATVVNTSWREREPLNPSMPCVTGCAPSPSRSEDERLWELDLGWTPDSEAVHRASSSRSPGPPPPLAFGHCREIMGTRSLSSRILSSFGVARFPYSGHFAPSLGNPIFDAHQGIPRSLSK